MICSACSGEGRLLAGGDCQECDGSGHVGDRPRPTFAPSPQQQAIFDWVRDGRGNAIVEAVAGSGKTTTLVEALAGMVEGGRTVAFAAYNKRIADDIGAKVAARGLVGVYTGTFHSFGLRIWRRAYPQVRVDDRKLGALMDARGVPKDWRGFVVSLVDLAKQECVGITSRADDPDVWRAIVDRHDLADKLTPPKLRGARRSTLPAPDLREAIEVAGEVFAESVESCPYSVDFADMLYAPLAHEVRYPSFDWVLVDEAQDSNPARRALAKRMLKPGGRFVAVGDRHQAIYGFTGADSAAMDLIKSEMGACELPLTVSWRCPRKVVDVARQWVSHIEPAPGAPEGTVGAATIGEMIEQVRTDRVAANGAVLCRLTAPLVDLAMKLLAADIHCHVEGRAIGRKLLELVDRFPKVGSLSELAEEVEDYREQRTAKLLAAGKEGQAEELADLCDCITAIAGAMPPGSHYAAFRDKVYALFADVPEGEEAPDLTLSTIHKSKGREWRLVYWLGSRKYQPSPWARQSWQQEQERNLYYVAATRSMAELVFVD